MRFAVLLLLLTATLTACTSQEEFTIGFIPAERAEEVTPKAQELAKLLEKEMNRKVTVVVPTSYEPLLEGLRFGHIDAAYMDSGPAWLAHKKANAEVVLAEIKKGNTFYYGEVFVRKDSPYETLEDLFGTRAAFTSWTGSSGFILPIGTMVDKGIIHVEGDDFASLEKALQQQFESHTVAGGYEQALTLVIEGKADFAGGAHDAPERFLSEEDQEKLKTLTRLGKVPSHPVVVGKHVDQETAEAFTNAMLTLNDPENIHILTNLYGVDGLQRAETQEHLGDFGPAFEALTGIQSQVLAKT